MTDQDRNTEALRLLDQVWPHVHYGLNHQSVEVGGYWTANCTDDPCPSIRAVLSVDSFRADSRPEQQAPERCPNCGGETGGHWFDRTLCLGGDMHTRCGLCGWALDGCEFDVPGPGPVRPEEPPE